MHNDIGMLGALIANARARLEKTDGVVPEFTQIGPHTVGRRYVEDALSVDISSCMTAYEGPVLIVHGALDGVVPLSYSQLAAERFGGPCQLEVIAELGHGFRAYPPELHECALGMALDFMGRQLEPNRA